MDFKTKFNAVVLVILLAMAGVTVVYSRTIYIDDTQNTISLWVTNSNGKIFNVTQSGLQQAIWDLNSTQGGTVELPVCNITITSPIYVTSNVWLRGTGINSVIYLADAANATMIKNQGMATWTDGWPLSTITCNKNIHLSDFRLEGNGMKQPSWFLSNNLYSQHRGIALLKTDNVFIERVTINNATAGGIILYSSNQSTVTNCDVNHWASVFKGTGKLAYFAKGIYVESSHNFSITNCRFHDGYSSGIALEGSFGASKKDYINNFIIDHCFIDSASSGVYVELARDGIISNCIATNCTNYELYTSALGFWITESTYNIFTDHCQAYKCGDPSDHDGFGFNIGGINNSLTNSQSFYSYGSGIATGSSQIMISNNRVINASRRGIYSNSQKPIITNNFILDSGTSGIYATATVATKMINNFGGIISGNYISNSLNYGIFNSLSNISICDNTINYTNSGYYAIHSQGSNVQINNNKINVAGNGIFIDVLGASYPKGNNSAIGNNIKLATTYGIRLSSSAKNNTVSSNIISGSSTGIYEGGTSNFNIIKDNVLKGCTTKITTTSTTTLVRDNLGYVTENWGVATVANNGTITHRLATTPTVVFVTGGQQNVSVNVNTLGATTFKVTIINTRTDAVYVGTITVYWYAKV